MPHILIEPTSNNIIVPSNDGTVVFNYKAVSIFNQDTKISVTNQNKTFLLTKKILKMVH